MLLVFLNPRVGWRFKVATFGFFVAAAIAGSVMSASENGWAVARLRAKHQAAGETPRVLPAARPADYLLFAANGVSLSAPSTWQRVRETRGEALTLRDPEGAWLSITCDAAHAGRSLEDTMDAQPSMLRREYAGLDVADAEVVAVPIGRAGMIQYMATDKDKRSYRVCQFVRAVGPKQYVLTVTTLPLRYATVKAQAEEAAASWHIAGETPGQ